MNIEIIFICLVKCLKNSKTAAEYLAGLDIQSGSEPLIGYFSKHCLPFLNLEQLEKLKEVGWLTDKGKVIQDCFVFPLYDEDGKITGLQPVAIGQTEKALPIMGENGISFLPPSDTRFILVSGDFVKMHQLRNQITVRDACSVCIKNENKESCFRYLSGLPRLEKIILFSDNLDAQVYPSIEMLRLKSVEVITVTKEIPVSEIEKKYFQREEILSIEPEEALITDWYDWDTNNENRLILKTERVWLMVLGGVKSSLDKLEITLKTSAPDQNYKSSYRAYVDLYNPISCKDFVRVAAPRLAIKSELLEEYLNLLTTELEKYREELRKPQPKFNSVDEKLKMEVMATLSDPELMNHTYSMLQNFGGLVGDESSLLAGFLCLISHISDETIHLGITGQRAGKFLHTLSELMPPEAIVHVGTLSVNALYYFSGELKHKILMIDKIDELDIRAGASVTEIVRHGYLRKAIPQKNDKNRYESNILHLEGPITVSVGMNKFSKWPGKEILIPIHLTEDSESEARILQSQRLKASGIISEDELMEKKKFIHELVRQLKKYQVKIPFAGELKLPPTSNAPLLNEFYLKFIGVITLYRQYSREVKIDGRGNEYLESTSEDVDWANRLLREVFIQKSDELSPTLRLFFERLKQYAQEQKLSVFKSRDIRSALKISPTGLKRNLNQLVGYGHLTIVSGSKNNGYEYCITDVEEYTLLKKTVDQNLVGRGPSVDQGRLVHATI